METFPTVFAFWLLYWWGGVTVGAAFHFTVYYISAKYASNFDGFHD